MEIELWSGNTKALISRDGGWLTNLSDLGGDILFPKRQLKAPDGTVKTRGGCHVCLPNFGPGGASELPQHGFGRTSLWELGDQSDSSVTLTLNGGARGYESLVSTITYELSDGHIKMTLNVQNIGKKPLRVAPAFHPYFALQSGETKVVIDDHTVELIELHEMQLAEGDQKLLITDKRNLTLTSENLPAWAQWTDQLGNYVCVEPTVGGYTFLNEKPAENELLKPNDKAIYSATMSW